LLSLSYPVFSPIYVVFSPVHQPPFLNFFRKNSEGSTVSFFHRYCHMFVAYHLQEVSTIPSDEFANVNETSQGKLTFCQTTTIRSATEKAISFRSKISIFTITLTL
jgi:hypothetical protein